MKNTALITGASNGIGKELAIIHAKNKGDLVLVARRFDLLDELKKELEAKYGVQVLIIQKDLTESDSALEIFNEIENKKIQIDYLINNAGFGGFGNFYDRKPEDDYKMIQLNITALTMLTKYFLPGMVKRNYGKILQVSSIAGFMPGPLQAVYFATKAYVLSLSHAISEELSAKNVTLTVLCPGPTITEFAKVADMQEVKMFKKGATAYQVALKGYNAMLKGKREIITDFKFKFLIKVIMPISPNSILLKIVKKLQSK